MGRHNKSYILYVEPDVARHTTPLVGSVKPFALFGSPTLRYSAAFERYLKTEIRIYVVFHCSAYTIANVVECIKWIGYAMRVHNALLCIEISLPMLVELVT